MINQLNDPFLLDGVISPYEEMVAYETLWASQGMTEKKISEIFKSKKLPTEALQNEMGFLESNLKNDVVKYLNNIDDNFSIAVHGDFQYPEKLRHAQYPVELFYYKGELNLIDEPCVSIVGSRKCSKHGLLRAEKMTKLLVKNGFTIVSGLALGVDTIALRTAIEAGGKVIGVIGTPINEYYPKENEELQKLIARDHLLISQVPFYRYNHEPFPVRRHNFPRRNATMSAISEGTVIIEAGDTSGTLTQARAAMYQKRKLFILNSCFENKNITWPSRYEKQGAIRVHKIDDIVSKLEKTIV